MKNYTVFNIERHHGSDPEIVKRYISDTIDRRIKNNLISPQLDVCIGSVFWEEYYFDDPGFLQLIYAVADSLAERSIRLVLLINDFYDHVRFDHPNLSVYFIDFFLWRVYDQIVVKHQSQINTAWNSSAKDFLFLTGKPHKPQRLRLLWKFQQHDLLTQCRWSLHLNQQAIHDSRWLIPELQTQDFDDFCQQYQMNPDDIKIETTADQTPHYNGIPYNAGLYHGSRFRVISETFCDDNQRPFITEKTWLTILNNVPFVMAGDRNSLRDLAQKGFRTFEQYCLLQDYDSIQPAELRLDAVVKNTEHFLHNHDFDPDIARDVHYNNQQFYINAERCRAVLDRMISQHQLQDADLDEICATDRYFRNW